MTFNRQQSLKVLVSYLLLSLLLNVHHFLDRHQTPRRSTPTEA